jgi:N,N'-diacetyllegionaminate synthase
MTSPIFIIAEIAQAHEGSLGILHSYIDAVAPTGVNAIKFQTHIAEAESSLYEPFRVKFSYVDNTRYEYWKRMEFSKEQWRSIKQHCDDQNLECISSPFSCAAVDLLEAVGINTYKIGSGEVTNFLMLEKIARTGKDIIVSSGMSSFEELDKTIAFLKPFHNNISLLQCTSQYPTPAEHVGLNVITEMKNRYRLSVGLSDHSGTIYPALAAVALGAEIIEVHITFDKCMFGPDSTSSLTIAELRQLVEGIRFLEKALNHPVNKRDSSQFDDLKTIFGKALCVNKDLPKGHCLTLDDLEGKKPGNMGIPAQYYQKVTGKSLRVRKNKWEFLQEDDLINA